MIQAILFIILFFIIIVLTIGFGLLKGIYKLFFGSSGKNRYSDNQSQREQNDTWHNQEKKKEKIFSKEDGEYIDFEEIIDDDKKKE